MSDELEVYHNYQQGIAEEECTCIIHKGPEYPSVNGPQPAEWEQNELCMLHGDPKSVALDVFSRLKAHLIAVTSDNGTAMSIDEAVDWVNDQLEGFELGVSQ